MFQNVSSFLRQKKLQDMDMEVQDIISFSASHSSCTLPILESPGTWSCNNFCFVQYTRKDESAKLWKGRRVDSW